MIAIEDEIKFEEIVQNLELELPSKMAVLPQNFFDTESGNEVFYNEEVQTLKKLFAKEGLIDIYCLKNNESIPFKSQKSAEWIAPTIFVTSLLLSENSNLISVALNVISNYATDALKGIPKRKQRVKMDVVYEITDKKKYAKITYEGEPEGIKELPKIIREIQK